MAFHLLAVLNVGALEKLSSTCKMSVLFCEDDLAILKDYGRMSMQTWGLGGLYVFTSRHTQLHRTPFIGGLISSAARLHMTAQLVEGVVMLSGVYQIRNQISGNRYIGSTKNIRQRWIQHLSALRCGRHPNPHLQAAFNKYGEDAFVFSILEEIESENLLGSEQFYLDTRKPEYNIALTAGSPMLGRHHSENTRARLREVMTGRHHSEDTKRKISAAQTPERRRAQSDRRRGRRHSAETRAKISQRGRAASLLWQAAHKAYRHKKGDLG